MDSWLRRQIFAAYSKTEQINILIEFKNHNLILLSLDLTESENVYSHLFHINYLIISCVS